MPLSAAPPDVDLSYPLTEDQIRQFREDGFIKLKNVFGADVLDFYGSVVSRLTRQHNQLKNVPVEERNAYQRAFTDVGNLWTKDPTVKTFSFSKRLARIVTELLGTTGVRMYKDQSFYKEPGGDITPWHADQQYWPLSSSLSVTAWIPLQATPLDMGPLSFGEGSHLKNIGRDLAISGESEQQIRHAVKHQGVREVQAPFELGDVSFHYGWTLHRAGPNTTQQPRKVHSITYIDVNMRLSEPKNDNQKRDWQVLSPTSQVGEIMADDLNPVLYRVPGA